MSRTAGAPSAGWPVAGAGVGADASGGAGVVAGGKAGPALRRGRLEVFLGYAPGVGKTHRLIRRARDLQEAGIPVVIGFVEPRGHPEILSMLSGLEVVPRRKVEFQDLAVEEMDLAAIIDRRPRVVVIDEAAHTNVPGSTHRRRYQDILALLEEGIDVLCAFDVRHLEGLGPTIARILPARVHDLIPDSFLRSAEEVIAVDLAVDELLERVRQGRVFPTREVPPAVAPQFQPSVLASFRELMLRETAEHLDRRVTGGGATRSLPGGGAQGVPALPCRVMVCVTSGSPRAQILLHRGSRLAGRLNTHWFVVCVESGPAAASPAPPGQTGGLGETLARAQDLGAEVVRLVADDPVAALLDFARSHGVSHIIVGRSAQPWWRQVLGWAPLSRLIWEAAGFDVHIVSFDQEEPPR